MESNCSTLNTPLEKQFSKVDMQSNFISGVHEARNYLFKDHTVKMVRSPENLSKSVLFS